MNAVFVLVIVLTLLQSGTLPMVARWLRVDQPAEASEVEADSAALDELDADLLQVRIPPGSRLHGVYVPELRLPPGATVSLVVRGGGSFTPNSTTRLQEGDQILVVSTAADRDKAERRIRAIHRAGRLARWLGESGR